MTVSCTCIDTIAPEEEETLEEFEARFRREKGLKHRAPPSELEKVENQEGE